MTSRKELIDYPLAVEVDIAFPIVPRLHIYGVLWRLSWALLGCIALHCMVMALALALVGPGRCTKRCGALDHRVKRTRVIGCIYILSRG
jgi:hypothetical protein